MYRTHKILLLLNEVDEPIVLNDVIKQETFKWPSKIGGTINISEMNATHLSNAIKFLERKLEECVGDGRHVSVRERGIIDKIITLKREQRSRLNFITLNEINL